MDLQNCQVVPSFDNQTSVPFDMDSMNQEVDYHMQHHQQQYCQDFDNFNINFDDLLLCGFIEKPKEDSMLMNQVKSIFLLKMTRLSQNTVWF